MGEKETAIGDELSQKASGGRPKGQEQQAAGGEPAEERNSGPRDADQGFRSGTAGDGGGSAEAAINNSHSNIKNLREAAGNDAEAEAVINNTKANIKNREGSVSHEDDWAQQGLAIGDQGAVEDRPRPKNH